MPKKQYTSAGDYLMFAEAWLLLAFARLILIVVPFKKIVPLMGYQKANSMPEAQRLQTLQRIKLSIARACVRSPWRTKCFEQALAAKMMTRRRGMQTIIYFGVKKDDGNDKLQAHAWLTCDEFIITGWQKVNTYTVVAVF